MDSCGLIIKGFCEDYDTLAAAVTEPAAGDAWAVGREAPYLVYIWDGAGARWVDCGTMAARFPYAPGGRRAPGREEPPYYLTAYGLAVKHGFEGTEEAWLDSLKGEQGEQGHGLVILGVCASYEALAEDVPEPEAGDAYGVGTEPPYTIYIWDGVGEQWVNYGTLKGAKGDDGAPGEPGEQGHGLVILGVYEDYDTLAEEVTEPEAGDAYGVGPEPPYTIYIWDGAAWIDHGTLKGERGETGAQGPEGPAGESAYQGACAAGYTGTEEEFYTRLGAVDEAAQAAETAKDAAEGYADAAQAAAQAAAGDQADAETARDDARTARDAAAAARSDALNAKSGAQDAAAEAKSYAVGGTGTRDGEGTDNAKCYSEQAATAAAGARDAAESARTYAGYAQEAKTDALSSKDAAAVSASDALSSKDAAAGSAGAASGSAADAEAAKVIAVDAKNDAVEAKEAAEAAQTAAEEAAATLTVDDELSGDSANPVENRVIKGALDKEQARAAGAYIAAPAAPGAAVSLADGAGDIPVRRLTVDILPVQSGSGDPAPDHVRPFIGRTGASIFLRGKNLLGSTVEQGNLNSETGQESTINRTCRLRTGYFTVKGGAEAVVSWAGEKVTRAYVYYYDQAKTHIGSDGWIDLGSTGAAFAPPAGCAWCRLVFGSSSNDISIVPADISAVQVELGEAGTGYEAYAGEDTAADFGRTVYAGSLTDHGDGAWTLRARPHWAAYDGEPLAGPWLSSMDVYAEGAAPTIGAEVVDLGGAETEYTLTLDSVRTLPGENHIWADCGDVTELVYRADPTRYLERALAQKQDELTFDSAPSAYSDHPVTSAGIYAALSGKQDTLKFDNVPDGKSSNPVTSAGLYAAFMEIDTALDEKQDTLTFDSAPAAGSANPVTSGGVKIALDAKQDTLTIDSVPTYKSTNPVQSGGVYTNIKALDTAIAQKQDTLTFDSAPTAGSANPVTSQGIKAAVDDVRAAAQSDAYAALVVKSASGNPVTFSDGADGVPLKALTVDILPAQSGSGDPAPDSIRTISGVSSLTLTREAETLTFNQLVKNGDFADASGWEAQNTSYGSVSVADGAGTYTITAIPDVYNPLGIRRSSIDEITIPNGHKVYLAATVTSSKTGSVRLLVLTGSQGWTHGNHITGAVTANERTRVAGIRTMDEVGRRPKVCWSSVAGLAVGDTLSVEDFVAVDLTLMYGAGNEPSTAEDFTADFPDACYAFTTGTKISRQPDGTWGAWSGEDHTFQFGQTIYGGTLDVLTGVLAVNKIGMVLDGTEDWHGISTVGDSRLFRLQVYGYSTRQDQDVPRGCSHYQNAAITTGTATVGYGAYTSSSAPRQVWLNFRPDLSVISTKEDWKAYLAAQYAAGTPVTCWFEITGSVTTIQLTPAQVTTLLGYNTIHTDNGGAVTASWRCDPTLIYQELTAAILSLGGNI